MLLSHRRGTCWEQYLLTLGWFSIQLALLLVCLHVHLRLLGFVMAPSPPEEGSLGILGILSALTFPYFVSYFRTGVFGVPICLLGSILQILLQKIYKFQFFKIDIGLLRFSILPCVSFGKLYFSRNTSILSNFKNHHFNVVYKSTLRGLAP